MSPSRGPETAEERTARAVDKHVGRASTRLTVAGLVVGTLLVQLAWIISVPPFRPSDEFDHAYRAASVARGEWAASRRPAVNGRGNLVAVPEELVSAAQSVCEALPYNGPDNCRPVRSLGGGVVEVASGASSYNPVFYAPVGAVGRAFDGNTSLYAMRCAAALLCALFIGLACWVTSGWARTHWPFVAMTVGMTPVMLFSTSVLAPNGLEMCAALSLWMSLLGLSTRRGRDMHGTRLILVAAASAAVVVTLRSLGPLWVGLIVLTCVGVIRMQALATIARRHAMTLGASALVVAACTVAAAQWTVANDTNQVSSSVGLSGGTAVSPISATLREYPLWLLQGIAAFPRRSDPAPALVYVLVGAVSLAFLVVGIRTARPRQRAAQVTCVVLALTVPFAISVVTIGALGGVWQGRYGLPFHIGVALLTGLALDSDRFQTRRITSWGVLGVGVVAFSQVLSILHLLAEETQNRATTGAGVWLQPPSWLVAALMLGGLGAWAWALIAIVVRGRVRGVAA